MENLNDRINGKLFHQFCRKSIIVQPDRPSFPLVAEGKIQLLAQFVCCFVPSWASGLAVQRNKYWVVLCLAALSRRLLYNHFCCSFFLVAVRTDFDLRCRSRATTASKQAVWSEISVAISRGKLDSGARRENSPIRKAKRPSVTNLDKDKKSPRIGSNDSKIGPEWNLIRVSENSATTSSLSSRNNGNSSSQKCIPFLTGVRSKTICSRLRAKRDLLGRKSILRSYLWNHMGARAIPPRSSRWVSGKKAMKLKETNTRPKNL